MPQFLNFRRLPPPSKMSSRGQGLLFVLSAVFLLGFVMAEAPIKRNDILSKLKNLQIDPRFVIEIDENLVFSQQPLHFSEEDIKKAAALQNKRRPKYKCPFKFGQFPDDEDCTSYYLCLFDKGNRKKCQNKQYFDTITKKCTEKSKAVCATKEDWTCPKPNGKFPSKGDCSKYVDCNSGIAIIQKCPNGMNFDKGSQECDWSPLVECEKDPSCPEANGMFAVKISGCRIYLECKNGKAIFHECQKNWIFNEKIGSCDYPELVECIVDASTTYIVSSSNSVGYTQTTKQEVVVSTTRPTSASPTTPTSTFKLSTPLQEISSSSTEDKTPEKPKTPHVSKTTKGVTEPTKRISTRSTTNTETTRIPTLHVSKTTVKTITEPTKRTSTNPTSKTESASRTSPLHVSKTTPKGVTEPTKRTSTNPTSKTETASRTSPLHVSKTTPKGVTEPTKRTSTNPNSKTETASRTSPLHVSKTTPKGVTEPTKRTSTRPSSESETAKISTSRTSKATPKGNTDPTKRASTKHTSETETKIRTSHSSKTTPKKITEPTERTSTKPTIDLTSELTAKTTETRNTPPHTPVTRTTQKDITYLSTNNSPAETSTAPIQKSTPKIITNPSAKPKTSIYTVTTIATATTRKEDTVSTAETTVQKSTSRLPVTKTTYESTQYFTEVSSPILVTLTTNDQETEELSTSDHWSQPTLMSETPFEPSTKSPAMDTSETNIVEETSNEPVYETQWTTILEISFPTTTEVESESDTEIPEKDSSTLLTMSLSTDTITKSTKTGKVRGCRLNDQDCQPDMELCPAKSGEFPHPDDPSLFVHCDHWRPYIKECPDSLVFDKTLRVCTWKT